MLSSTGSATGAARAASTVLLGTAAPFAWWAGYRPGTPLSRAGWLVRSVGDDDAVDAPPAGGVGEAQ